MATDDKNPRYRVDILPFKDDRLRFLSHSHACQIIHIEGEYKL
jgi:hypothetical protein